MWNKAGMIVPTCRKGSGTPQLFGSGAIADWRITPSVSRKFFDPGQNPDANLGVKTELRNEGHGATVKPRGKLLVVGHEGKNDRCRRFAGDIGLDAGPA